MASDVSKQLTEQLREYGKLTTEEVDSIITEVGKEACEQVKNASPRRKGKYKRGWKVKIERHGTKTDVTVYNSQWQLTHLLEFGHKTRLGTGKSRRRYGRKAFVSGQPHIGPANDWAQREVESRIRKKLGGG